MGAPATWLLALASAVLGAVMLSRLLGLFRVQGDSMAPTVDEGEWVLSRRYLPWQRPRQGEVVIVAHRAPPPVLIKRVLAGPGQGAPSEVGEVPRQVPEGQYLLASDNTGLAASWLGPVARAEIRAKVLAVIWPCRRWRRVT